MGAKGGLARLAQILWVLASGAARALWRRERLAEAIVDSFVELGPTFVKLGQLAASSPGLFPPTFADACLRCLDDVPPFDAATARDLIRTELGRDPEELFASFDDEPLSAASVAQVHACVLADGRQAVVKLQRPGIAETMHTDLRILHRLARLAAKTRRGRQMNVVGIVEELQRVTQEELDFELEARRQELFRKNLSHFGDNRGVTVAEVYWEHCSPRIICMERLFGVPIDEFDQLQARHGDSELLLRRGAKVWTEALLVHGPFHGDVHAGNLWFLDDGRVAFLDFGIMGELPEEWRECSRALRYTLAFDKNFSRVIPYYRNLGVIPAGIQGTDEQLGQVLAATIGPYFQTPVGELDLREVIRAQRQMLDQLSAVAPKELVLMVKQLLYFERYAKVYAPGYVMTEDLFLLRNVFPDEVQRRIRELEISLPDEDDPAPPAPAPPRSSPARGDPTGSRAASGPPDTR